MSPNRKKYHVPHTYCEENMSYSEEQSQKDDSANILGELWQI